MLSGSTGNPCPTRSLFELTNADGLRNACIGKSRNIISHSSFFDPLGVIFMCNPIQSLQGYRMTSRAVRCMQLAQTIVLLLNVNISALWFNARLTLYVGSRKKKGLQTSLYWGRNMKLHIGVQSPTDDKLITFLRELASYTIKGIETSAICTQCLGRFAQSICEEQCDSFHSKNPDT